MTGLAIASTLAAALKTEAKAFQLSQQHVADDDDFIVTSAYAEKPMILSGSSMSGDERGAESLKKLLPYQVQPSKLAASLEKIVTAEGGFAAAAARSADNAHANRVHLIVAQVLASAYVVRTRSCAHRVARHVHLSKLAIARKFKQAQVDITSVATHRRAPQLTAHCCLVQRSSASCVQALVEVGEALGLRSAMHPRLADTTPIASSLTDMQLDSQALAAADEQQGSKPAHAGSLTVQLMTNAATGELRYVDGL